MDSLRTELTSIARTAAVLIGGDDHLKLTSERKEGSFQYWIIKSKLQKIKRANNKIENIYTMSKTGKTNIWEFVVDSDENPETMVHLGDTYDVAPYPQMKTAFEGPIADKEISSDKWGTSLSGYAPIYDSSGRAVAIVGIDISADRIATELAKQRSIVILPVLILFILPAAISLLILRKSADSLDLLSSMTQTARKIADGDYDQRIVIKSDNDISELAVVFNNMAETISLRVGTSGCMAKIDGLTDTYNHRYLQECLEEEIAFGELYGRNTALMIVDIDQFKRFNTINGMADGDTALKDLAKLIKTNVRNKDVVARFGGDEFSVLLPNTLPSDAVEIAQTIIAAAETHEFHTKHNLALNLSIGIGIACYPDHGESPDELIRAAYFAAGVAKQAGKNQIRLFNNSDILGNDKDEGYNSIDKAIVDVLAEDMTLSAVYSLAKAVDARDRYTREHSEFVALYAAKLGKAIGLDEDSVKTLSIAGLLHDIGKIGVPDVVLHKPGTLNEEDWRFIKQHPTLGAEILGNLNALPKNVISAVLHHHENIDGNGYPNGLKGPDIPLSARILAVVDSYHAMVSDRPYRHGLSFTEATSELIRNKGIRLDPRLVDAFLELIVKEKAAESGAA